jgi:DNA-binding NtrC family response regulator
MFGMPDITRRRKILIIDDEVNVAETLGLIFSTSGYEVYVVASAEAAIELIPEWRPDVAIVDVMLPRMNGIDLAIVLKSNYPGCRIVLFSGQPDSTALLEEAWKKGHHFEILAKPLHPGFILDTVSNLLATTASSREQYADA